MNKLLKHILNNFYELFLDIWQNVIWNVIKANNLILKGSLPQQSPYVFLFPENPKSRKILKEFLKRF